MWPGCIYAAVRDVRVIESALPQEPLFSGAHGRGNSTVAVWFLRSKQRAGPERQCWLRVSGTVSLTPTQFVEFVRVAVF